MSNFRLHYNFCMELSILYKIIDDASSFIKYCKLNNITIDASTAAALNALSPWDANDYNLKGFAVDSDITTDPTACSAIEGSIQTLFKGKATFVVTASVLGTQINNPLVATSGVTPTLAGIVAVVGSNPTQGIGNGGRLIVHLNEAVDLDVGHLRQHRHELYDLVLTSNKAIASGAFGGVWLGIYRPQQVAIKRLKSRESRQVQKFIDEIISISQLDSPYIVKFVGASWTRPIEIECVVEFMDLGDLRSYLVSQSPYEFTWDQKYQSILSIVRGLVYLHTYRPPVIHRDLKSRNVLLDSVKGTKLTDFGTSRVAEEDDLMTNGIGTYQWMAPEVIAGTNYSAPADIYSFGEVREGRLRPSFVGVDVPELVIDLAMQCLVLKDQDRTTALEISSRLNQIKF
ncbi:kinase [Thraustotheca clavata]|uniref:Kinase n=1 Tax=Thraustotheca clavata TaxID=74557 RepID=A0A1V9ZWG7_9STRA|nr:kinase [Thraustotheca clavata]